MLLKSVRMQMSAIIRKKTVIFTYFVLLAFVMINFFVNVFRNADVHYITQMYDPIKMLTLSDWSVCGHFMMEYYPLLVVIPTATVYLVDRDTRIKVYLQSKLGSGNYWFGKMLTVFMITFLIFTLPFLQELILNVLCFDMQSAGDPSNISYLNVIEKENRYFLSAVFLKNKILYAVINIILFGLVSAVLAVFNFSVTTLPVFRYKIFTFFPIYILFYLITLVDRFVNVDYTINYFFILRMFNTVKKNYTVYFLFFVLILCISLLLVWRKSKKDDLL